MRFLVTMMAVVVLIGAAEARGRRGGGRHGGHCSPCGYGQPQLCQPRIVCQPQPVLCQPGTVIRPQVITPPIKDIEKPKGNGAHKHKETGAIAEVNAARAARGLPPFIEDASLTRAAQAAATYRASALIEGHTGNDFQFLPAGATAAAAGCAAWEPSLGWGACCTYENWRVAGAAVVTGRNGKRFMHLFVR